ncbi:hypothetical protein ABFK62_12940 [Acinetobacter baumannii]|uniref:hypothetical protein n=1 Tax=Acinetobacter baumannii TaxID=470 RepID=UPI00074372BB|nr:hypothetical protein [Acinetobacter baumannii]
MTDMNKLRSEFEALPEVKQWIERLIYGDKSEVYIPVDETEENNAIATWINGAWFVWKLKAKAQAGPDTHVVVPKDVAERTIGHIGIAMCHPNNTHDDENIMNDDQQAICKAVEASESGAEG